MRFVKLPYLSIIVFLILIESNSYSQEIKSDISYSVNEYITWVSQYPINPNKEDETGFLNWLDLILFGKKANKLIKPISVFAINPDSIWILDQGKGAIYQYANKSDNSPDIISSKEYIYLSLVGMCKYNHDKLLFTDSKLNKVFVLNTKDQSIKSFTECKLQQPTGIAYSPQSKTIWIVETALHRISVFDEEGKLLRIIGKRGTELGEYNFPTFIWIDNSEKVYIVDAMNFRIQILNIKGEGIKAFGEAGNATGYFARPKGIATDSYGNIYIVDALYHTVQIFDQEGNFLYNFGSQGQDKEEFWIPTGIFIDNNNYIYIADTYNSRVQIFKLNYEK